jgi:SAM-dependent methyltransferase
MHFMRSAQLPQIFQEVYRAIEPGGLFILVDFHLTNPVFWTLLAVFLCFFETETDLGSLLAQVGWRSYNSEEDRQPKLYAGGNIQVIQLIYLRLSVLICLYLRLKKDNFSNRR